MRRCCIPGCMVLNVLLLILCASMWPCLCRNSTSFCRDDESDALLKFRQSISDPSGLLSSWAGKDCCEWEGIRCDAATGHVIRLELLPSTEWYRDWYYGISLTSSTEQRFHALRLSPDLLRLKHLNHLDLSGLRLNEGSTIPEFIGSMKQIRYLNLSSMGFYGTIPSNLGNLTNLEVLDLRNYLSRSMNVSDAQWISRLVALKHLDLTGAQLSQARNLFQSLTMLPSLVHLALSYCSLDNVHLSHIRLLNSSSLANLRYLDLSQNSFQGQIPSPIQNMTSLIYLDVALNYLDSLGSSFLSGPRLEHLDISGNDFQGQIPSPIQNMSSLIYLAVSFNYLDSLGSSFLSGPSLEHLDISHNLFQGQIPRALQNMTSLTYLDTSINDFYSVPPWFVSLKSLIHMDLSGNALTDPVGGLILRDKCNLRFVDLYYCYFRGEMFGNSTGFCASNLESLSASSTYGHGELPQQLGYLKNLKYLRLSGNSFTGPIPDSWGKLHSLLSLDLSQNQLNGDIRWLGQLRLLRSVDLTGNAFTGAVPESLGQFRDLERLDFSGNSLEGTLSEVHFANLSRLNYLDLSDNRLTIKIKSDWVPPFQLEDIRMASCKFESEFPQWLRTQEHVEKLILSNASISGEIPEWFGNRSFSTLDLSHNLITGVAFPGFSSYISNLDLSHNQISGQIAEWFGNRSFSSSYLDLSHNQIFGPIPQSFCKLEFLEELDLSGNKLSGHIPNCWKSGAMSIINLSSNNLSGLIPSSFGNLTDLGSLHLNNNSLYGDVPVALRFSTGLTVLDLGDNSLSGYLPWWIGNYLQSLKVLKLRNNQFNGTIPLEFCSLSQLKWVDLALNQLSGTIPTCFRYLWGMTIYERPIAEPRTGPKPQDDAPVSGMVKGNELEYITTNIQSVPAMDLSGNNLVGSIPEELANLTGLRFLNLSHNLLQGNIPGKVGNMKVLESLDVSGNNLSGKIPSSISNLTFLARLDLSDNNFSGRIPRSNQLDTLYAADPFMYAGNPQLCGDPLPIRCSGDKVPEPPEDPADEEHGSGPHSSENTIFYGVVAAGFATGFWGLFGILIFKKSWRVAYFRFAEEAADRAYVAVVVKVSKLKRRMRSG